MFTNTMTAKMLIASLLLAVTTVGARADRTVSEPAYVPIETYANASLINFIDTKLSKNTDNRSTLAGFSNRISLPNGQDDYLLVGLIEGTAGAYLTYTVTNSTGVETITMQDNLAEPSEDTYLNGMQLPGLNNASSFASGTTIDFFLTKNSQLLADTPYHRVIVFTHSEYSGFFVACEDGDDWDYRDRVFWISETGTTNTVSTATTEITIENSSTNSITNTENCNVTLNGRTFHGNGVWNTLCLPFALSATQLANAGCPLKDATIKTLTGTSHDTTKDELTLNFSDATEIVAGKPYIVKWSTVADITNPKFWDVNITATTASTAPTTYATMTGCLSPVILTANDRTKIYFGASNKLYYPTKDVTIGSCRAYFQLLNGLNAPTSATAARTIVMDFGDGETTRIVNTEDDSSPFSLDSSLDEWFSLDGHPLDGYPAQRSAEGRLFPQGLKKGIYINKGKKSIIR